MKYIPYIGPNSHLVDICGRIAVLSGDWYFALDVLFEIFCGVFSLVVFLNFLLEIGIQKISSASEVYFCVE